MVKVIHSSCPGPDGRLGAYFPGWAEKFFFPDPAPTQHLLGQTLPSRTSDPLNHAVSGWAAGFGWAGQDSNL
jgi:hypothetical protein